MVANGRIDVGTLTPISGTYLAPVTAHAFVRMAAACFAATGVRLDIVNGSGGYRDIDAQTALYRSPPRGIRVAAPGKSTHGFGTALDLTTTCYTLPVARWCRAHCGEYGFALPPSGDPRHFLHNGTTVGPANQQENDMQLTDQVPANTGDASVAAYLYYTRTDVARILAGQTALTAAVQTLAASKGITDPASLIATITEQVEQALKDDFAGIAKTVNDDAARRLSQ